MNDRLLRRRRRDPHGSRLATLGSGLLLLSAVGATILPPSGNEAAVAASSSFRTAQDPPVVIAVIEPGGLNVLHSDYKALPGQDVRPPQGRPRAIDVRLPARGGFSARVAAARRGALGRLEAGKLYSIEGTRIIGIYVPSDIGRRGPNTIDIFAEAEHPTGTTSSAVGVEHGTNPDALLVFVPRVTKDAWRWLAEQDWIDVVSTSYYSVFSSIDGFCLEAPYVRKIVDQGRLVFSASGNVEHAGLLASPSGLAEAYQVGGVGDGGRTYLADHASEEPAVTPTRPYETGDRFHFDAAAHDSLNGSAGFGGTSGAAPSTAGRAAELIQFARSILGDSGNEDGTIATLDQAHGARLPARGPLSDGDFTNVELVDLLHDTAMPAFPATPSGFLVEGYGALSSGSVALAKSVLAGEIAQPDRIVEDLFQAQVEAVRDAMFPAERCG